MKNFTKLLLAIFINCLPFRKRHKYPDDTIKKLSSLTQKRRKLRSYRYSTNYRYSHRRNKILTVSSYPDESYTDISKYYVHSDDKVVLSKRYCTSVLVVLGTILAWVVIIVTQLLLKDYLVTKKFDFGIRLHDEEIASHDGKENHTSVLEDYKIQENLACNFPKVDINNEDVKPYLKTEDNITCPLENQEIFEVHYNGNLIRLRDPSNINPKCIKIKKRVTKIPHSFDYIAIRCLNRKTRKSEYVDMFAMTHLKEVSLPTALTPRQKVNVIILGLDATSNLNFKRIMPKTMKYLTKTLSSIGLQWLNKNGDNTLPNVMTALTGYSVPEMRSRGWEDPSNYFDECPFIWKRFAKEGYRTVLGEDLAGISTFGYNKAGFIDKPTDFYLRPLTLIQEKHLKSNWRSHLPACFGPRMSSVSLLNWMKRLTTAFEEKGQNYFQFYWSMSLTHSSLNQGAILDDVLLSTFQWFNNRNYLNNTVFILMSDHGFRFGGYRNTYFGDIENKMPFAYFTFPPWFRQMYPTAIKNFQQNADHRLTTFFDFHRTTKDLLDLDWALPEPRIESRTKKLNLTKKVPKSISLFLPVPKSRTCQNSGIPQGYCICNALPKLKNLQLPVLYSSANFLTDQINKIVSRNPRCSQLILKKIVTANGFLSEDTLVDKSREYLHSVTIMTDPGEATFEVMLRNMKSTRQEVKDDYAQMDTEMEWEMVGDITRTNSYGNHSFCVKEEALKLFCFCKM
ncbi:unnamed protein product [Orchesella dallaii]|uniref:Iduronate 2-sulfatase n=1 Tax=Orchesella dallaii TaxID=48710 RepID=A0ABP1QB72_9HEXA